MKAHLSSAQKIGLKYYEDFLDRMPREEAAAIEKVVKPLYLYISISLCTFHHFMLSNEVSTEVRGL